MKVENTKSYLTTTYLCLAVVGIQTWGIAVQVLYTTNRQNDSEVWR